MVVDFLSVSRFKFNRQNIPGRSPASSTTVVFLHICVTIMIARSANQMRSLLGAFLLSPPRMYAASCSLRRYRVSQPHCAVPLEAIITKVLLSILVGSDVDRYSPVLMIRWISDRGRSPKTSIVDTPFGHADFAAQQMISQHLRHDEKMGGLFARLYIYKNKPWQLS